MPETSQAFKDLPTFDTEMLKSGAAGGKSVMFKGPSGSGKTRAALTFPGRKYVIYADPNTETVKKMAALGEQLKVRPIQGWKEYKDIIVPEIRRRSIQCETIVLDTLDFLMAMMWDDIQGSSQRLTIPDFGTGLTRASETTRDLVDSCKATPDHPGYHVVFNCHTKDVTDDKGGLLRTVPGLMGQFADKVEAYFDYVMLCRSEIVTEVKSAGGQNTRETRAVYKILTVPPDRYNTCKGGGLPAEIVVPEDASAFEILNQSWKIPV